ncbi:uncharacterized protein DS421_14g448950 [Arachis hypogaea]|nr:uncharacterized protein DS421_14g448950 [Arachis hypogaea]
MDHKALCAKGRCRSNEACKRMVAKGNERWHEKLPQCTQHHSIPAVILSTSSYIGNHFHEFTDTIIPLFLTSTQFNGQVKFGVSEMRPWWISKYQAILGKLSNYEVLNIGKDNQVHWFSGRGCTWPDPV